MTPDQAKAAMLIPAVLVALQLGFMGGFKWRDVRAREEIVQLVETNREAIRTAEKTLTFNLDEARTAAGAATIAFEEADAYDPSPDADLCAIPADGVQLLRKF